MGKSNERVFDVAVTLLVGSPRNFVEAREFEFTGRQVADVQIYALRRILDVRIHRPLLSEQCRD